MKYKKIIILGVILILLGLVVFFYPKSCGSGFTGYATRGCECLGVESNDPFCKCYGWVHNCETECISENCVKDGYLSEIEGEYLSTGDCLKRCRAEGFSRAKCIHSGSGVDLDKGCVALGGKQIFDRDNPPKDCDFEAIGSWEECCCF